MISFWKVKKPIEKNNMNWAQAKWNYPKLKPMSDYDRDGVKNQFDCRPFDRKRQHVNSDSKWKKQIIEDFPTVGDLKHFVEDKKNDD